MKRSRKQPKTALPDAIDALRLRMQQQLLFGYSHTHEWIPWVRDSRFLRCTKCRTKCLAKFVDNPKRALRRVLSIVGDQQIVPYSTQFSNTRLTASVYITEAIRWRRTFWDEVGPEFQLVVALPAPKLEEDPWKRIPGSRQKRAIIAGISFHDVNYKRVVKAARKHVGESPRAFFEAVARVAHGDNHWKPVWWERYENERA